MYFCILFDSILICLCYVLNVMYILFFPICSFINRLLYSFGWVSFSLLFSLLLPLFDLISLFIICLIHFVAASLIEVIFLTWGLNKEPLLLIRLGVHSS